MKSKDANTTLQAYKIILKKKKFKLPTDLISDGGAEFKGDFQKYLSKNDVAHQTTTRHRQLLPVDRICFILGKYLNKIMLSEEMKTGKVNKSDWKMYLTQLIEILNTSYIKKPVDVEKLDPVPLGKGEVLQVGQKVRLLLEKPTDYLSGKVLSGKFRAGDIRYTKEMYTIDQVLINPSQPVTYILKDNKDRVLKNIAFNESELKITN